jgi:hypothetical protein
MKSNFNFNYGVERERERERDHFVCGRVNYVDNLLCEMLTIWKLNS